MSIPEELSKLQELHRDGALSDAEFERAQAALFNSESAGESGAPNPAEGGGVDEGLGCALDEIGNPPAAEQSWTGTPGPAGAPEPVSPEYKLFSPGCVALIAFLFGPVAGFILLTINFWRLGKRRAAWMTVAFCTLAMAPLVAILIALPDSFPGVLVSVPLFLSLWAAAGVLQGSDYAAHRSNGGESPSGWSAVGFGLLGLVLFVVVFLGIFLTYDYYFDEGFGQKIDYGGSEVFYAKEVSETDARALGTFLRESGFFDDSHPKSVRLSLDRDRLVICFIVREAAVNDPQVQQGFQSIGQKASQRAFGGRPVVVELCGEDFTVKKRLRSEM
jgi:hypothetical protein